MMKMKETESIRDYVGRLIGIVNLIRLLSKAFPDHKVVEKIIVFVPQRFEAKNFAIEKSNDLLTLSIAELTHKLHAQQQRNTLNTSEKALVALKKIQGSSLIRSFQKESQTIIKRRVCSLCATLAKGQTML